jgi:protein SCO1
MMDVHLLKYLTLFCYLSTLACGALAGDASTISYQGRGVVEKIAPDLQSVTIDHEAIPGYMMAMTMDFPVQNTNELKGVSSGDQIRFTLFVNKNNDWVENIQRTGLTMPVMTNLMQSMSAVDPELKAGDLLPDGILTTEDGQPIHFSDFHGQALAFTFFFTRCPMPNYCPLMNRNFAAARAAILSTSSAPTNWEFLSISFDSENDTPETLKRYASYYRSENSNHWLFAATTTNTLAILAPALDLMVVHQGASISHNLRTVVLDPQGRIYRQFDGNQWTPQELAEAVLNAARQ